MLGELTWRGVSQPLSLFERRFGCRKNAGTEVCSGDFEGQMLRSDFGSTYGLPWIANPVRLVVQVEGRRR